MNRLAVALFLCLCLDGVGHATTIKFQMTLEDASNAADIVVLGTVVESPEFGEYRQQSGVVVRRHTIRVDGYYKGSGPDQITVETLGGNFIREHDGDKEVAVSVVGGQPRLPGVGDRAVMFLTRYGSENNYMICSATHGVLLPRHTAEGDVVVVTLQQAVEESSGESGAQRSTVKLPQSATVTRRVSLSSLAGLVQEALARRNPGDAESHR